MFWTITSDCKIIGRFNGDYGIEIDAEKYHSLIRWTVHTTTKKQEDKEHSHAKHEYALIW